MLETARANAALTPAHRAEGEVTEGNRIPILPQIDLNWSSVKPLACGLGGPIRTLARLVWDGIAGSGARVLLNSATRLGGGKNAKRVRKTIVTRPAAATQAPATGPLREAQR
jgi:hypothetical protein